MKKLILAIGVALCCVTVNAQFSSNVLSTVDSFFKNNPTNAIDITAYGLQVVESKEFGAGTRMSYWLTPSVGAALDVSYVNGNWTFTSLALGARGTVKLGDAGSVSPFVSAGSGWNIKGPEETIVAIGTAGATIHINRIKYFDLFGEYQYISGKETENRIAFGITKKF